MTINSKATVGRPAGLRRQRGLSTVEYAVAGSVVLIVTVVAFATLGDAAAGKVRQVAEAISNAPP